MQNVSKPLALFWLFSVCPSCDLKQTVFISLFTGSQPYLGELFILPAPVIRLLTSKRDVSQGKRHLSEWWWQLRGALCCRDSAHEQTAAGPDEDLIPFLSPIHSCWVSFPHCTNYSSGSSLWQRRICEIPALQPWLWDVLTVHSLAPGKLQQSCFSRSVVIMAGMSCSVLALYPRLLI